MPVFTAAEAFYKDFERLDPDDRNSFRNAAEALLQAYARGEEPPAALRVQPVVGAAGVYEMVWGINGRATFSIDFEPAGDVSAVRWRRVARMPPGAADADAVPRQLPSDVLDFTDREDALHAANMVFERRARERGGPAVLAIWGQAGVGKSALAVHLAHQLVPRFPDGQLFINLGEPEQGEPSEVLKSLLRALGMSEASIPRLPHERATSYRSRLAGRRLLVVLDNARHEAQVRPLLPGAPTCGAIITSRQQLAGLDVAVQLNLEVRASFSMTYGELRPTYAHAFRLLGLLEGPAFGREVAAALLGPDFDNAGAALERLVDAQLLEAVPKCRYRFHDLLGVFARERLAAEEAPAEQRAALERAFNWYLELATRARVALKPDRDRVGVTLSAAEAVEQLEDERANLVAAVEQAARLGFDKIAVALAIRLGRFLELRTHLDDWERTHEIGLQAARRLRDSRAEAIILRKLGTLYRELYRFDEAQRVLKESLEIVRRDQDRNGEAMALDRLGKVYQEERRFEEATGCFEQSLAIFRECGDRYGEALTLESLAILDREQGQFDQAVGRFEQSLTILREAGDRLHEGWALHHLGLLYRLRRDFGTAESYFEQSMAILRASLDRWGVGWNLNRLGVVRREQNRLDEAARYHEAALAILRAVGDRWGEGWTLNHLGTVATRQGHLEEAIERHRGALALFRELHERRSEAKTLLMLGAAARAWGDERSSREHGKRARAILAELGEEEAEEFSILLAEAPQHPFNS